MKDAPYAFQPIFINTRYLPMSFLLFHVIKLNSGILLCFDCQNILFSDCSKIIKDYFILHNKLYYILLDFLPFWHIKMVPWKYIIIIWCLIYSSWEFMENITLHRPKAYVFWDCSVDNITQVKTYSGYPINFKCIFKGISRCNTKA